MKIRRSFTCIGLLLVLTLQILSPGSCQAAETLDVRVMSYNIHHAAGVDGKLDVDRIAKVIASAKPDVVALQEVDQNCNRTGNVDQAAEIAGKLGFEFVFGQSIELPGGGYGNAILSRWKIKDSQVLQLPNPDQGEQRTVLQVTIEESETKGTFRVLATHFDHRRPKQTRTESAEFVRKHVLDHSPMMPTILTGDLNAEWSSSDLTPLHPAFQPTSKEAQPTVPVSEPARQIDFVAYRPSHHWTTTSSTILNEAVASDHRAIVAELKLDLMPPPVPGKLGQWHGFDRYEFDVAGRTLTVVVPREAAPGRPWVWHGEFFGHKPAPDIALLERGFHLAYLRVPNMLGSPGAVELWDEAWLVLRNQLGLARQCALVGLSRGGLYVYNWALAHPERVACIYGDAPVCDFKSWPGGFGQGKGSPRDWKLVLSEFGFKNDEAARAFSGNPVDRVAELAEYDIPLLHVFGDADEVVPWDENTGLMQKRYKAAGGEFVLIRKPGVGHHPHGLEDSTAIVEFIAKHALPEPEIPQSK